MAESRESEGRGDGGIGRITEGALRVPSVTVRKKETEILYIFFGFHAASMMKLAERLKERQEAKAA